MQQNALKTIAIDSKWFHPIDNQFVFVFYNRLENKLLTNWKQTIGRLLDLVNKFLCQFLRRITENEVCLTGTLWLRSNYSILYRYFIMEPMLFVWETNEMVFWEDAPDLKSFHESVKKK